MKKKQYYGIKFPFTSNNRMGFFIDLNEDKKSKIESEIAHVLLTPKGTRLRMPDFGTDLVNYIFSPSDSYEWEDIKKEVKDSVSRYVKNVAISDIEVVAPETEDNSIFLDIHYTFKNGIKDENNRLAIKL